MKILVTGAAGALGRNLVENLKAIRDGKNRTRPNLKIDAIYEYDRNNTEEDLDRFCSDCDFIVHAAGVNRPKETAEFMEGNFGFTSTLLDCLISIKAERQKQYRVRKRNNDRTDAEKEEKLWQELIYLQGCLFTTSKGLDFTYKIHGGEMFVDRKEKSITRATVMKTYGKVVELEGEVKGPKVLGTFGASYLYPIFVKMGLIKSAGA